MPDLPDVECFGTLKGDCYGCEHWDLCFKHHDFMKLQKEWIDRIEEEVSNE